MIFYSMDIYVEPSNHANNETDHGSATIIYNNTLQKSFEFFEETLDCHRIYYGEMVNIRYHIDIKSHKNYIDSWADEWTDIIDVPFYDSEDDEYVEFHMERADSHPVIIAKKVKLKDECYELYPQLMDKIHLLCY